MPGSSSAAGGGTRGRCQLPIATTTLSASKRRSPVVTTKPVPFLDTRSTRRPVRTGSSKRAAYASRYAAISSLLG